MCRHRLDHKDHILIYTYIHVMPIGRKPLLECKWAIAIENVWPLFPMVDATNYYKIFDKLLVVNDITEPNH